MGEKNMRMENMVKLKKIMKPVQDTEQKIG